MQRATSLSRAELCLALITLETNSPLVRQIKSLRSTRDYAVLGSSGIHRGMLGWCRPPLSPAITVPLAAQLRHKAPPVVCNKSSNMHGDPSPPPPLSHAHCTLQCEAPAVVLLLCKTYQSRISDHALMWNLFLVCQRKERKRTNKRIGFKYD